MHSLLHINRQMFSHFSGKQDFKMQNGYLEDRFHNHRHSSSFPEILLLSMMSYGMEDPYSPFRSPLLSLAHSQSPEDRVKIGQALMLCKHCSGATQALVCVQHCFAHKSKIQNHKDCYKGKNTATARSSAHLIICQTVPVPSTSGSYGSAFFLSIDTVDSLQTTTVGIE